MPRPWFGLRQESGLVLSVSIVFDYAVRSEDGVGVFRPTAVLMDKEWNIFAAHNISTKESVNG